MQKELSSKLTDIQEQINVLKLQTDNHKINLKQQKTMIKNGLIYSKTEIFKIVNKEKFLEGMSPLHLACEYGLNDIAINLIENGAKINIINKVGMTPLHLACKYVLTKVAIVLLKNGANVNVSNKEGMTPLHLLCKNEYLVKTYNLINGNFDDNVIISNQFAFKIGHKLSILIHLLSNGADISYKNNDGWTCLHFAAHGGYIEMVNELIKQGVDIHCKIYSGYTALHMAAIGKCGIFKYDVNSKIIYKIEKLYDAGDHYLSIVNELLDHGADFNCKNMYKNSPLHLASFFGNVSIVKTLLKNGTSINDINSDGDTPIHLAVQTRQIDVLAELLNQGVDVNCKNNNGQTVFDFAKKDNNREVLDILKSYKTTLK